MKKEVKEATCWMYYLLGTGVFLLFVYKDMIWWWLR